MPLTDVDNKGISVIYSPDTRDEHGNYYHGTMATYSCSSGFSLNGTQTRMCVGDSNSTVGMFNERTPTCEGESIVNQS